MGPADVKPTPRELLIGLTVVVVGLWWYTASQRRQGALNEKLRVADSTHAQAVKAQAIQHDSAVAARALADTLRNAARREARRDAIAEAETDSSLRASGDERARAMAILADSAAVLGTVRDALAAVVRSSQQDSVSFAVERAQHARTVASLTLALTQDSLTIQQGIRETNAALRRATAAENQRDILRKQMPSTALRWVERGTSVAAIIYLVGKK